MDKAIWDQRYAATPAMWSADPNLFIKARYQNQHPAQVIDLGGGEGRNALWFATNGATVENVEISKIALERYLLRAEQLGVTANCHATEADATAQPIFSLKQADLLIISYLQLPAAALANALANAISQLVAGAEIFGVWHAVENFSAGFGGPPNLEMLVSASQLLEFGQIEGLENLVVENRDRQVETDNGVKVSKDVVLIANR